MFFVTKTAQRKGKKVTYASKSIKIIIIIAHLLSVLCNFIAKKNIFAPKLLQIML